MFDYVLIIVITPYFITDSGDFTGGVEMLSFTQEGQLCANVSITMDSILENNELIIAVLGSQDDAVNLTLSTAYININENDGIHMKFL